MTNNDTNKIHPSIHQIKPTRGTLPSYLVARVVAAGARRNGKRKLRFVKSPGSNSPYIDKLQ